jgi:hypothetical protein
VLWILNLHEPMTLPVPGVWAASVLFYVITDLAVMEETWAVLGLGACSSH